MFCLDAGVLVFVEVSRVADALVGGYYSIDTHKKRVLQRGSKAHIYKLQNSSKHVRFDVIDVSLSDEGEGCSLLRQCTSFLNTILPAMSPDTDEPDTLF